MKNTVMHKIEKFIKSFFSEKGKKVKKSTEKRIKNLFRFYFEGSYGIEAINYIPIRNFQITDIEIKEYKKRIKRYEITITLERPGILIGKGGRTIDGITKYLMKQLDRKVNINVKESKLW